MISYVVRFPILYQNLRKKNKKMTKEDQKFKKIVEGAMHKYKRGQLKSGNTEKIVKSRKQAIAIGLSEARQES